MKERALITGASSGIGLELARQFAKHGHPLVITAPVESELQALARALQSDYSVDVQIVARDLEDPQAPQQIFDVVERSGAQIDILVNNAGLGRRGNFWEIPLEDDLKMLRVNIGAVVRLTKLFLPPMIARGGGRILNTASVAGFEPGPTLAVYHATKAFVLSLSEALATELQDAGVTVTALCPGATDTDFFPKASMEDTKIFQKGNVMPPQEVAEKGYDAMMRGERVFVPGAMNKALVFSRRFLPESAQAKVNEQFYEEHDGPRKRERGDVENAAVENSGRKN
jgi:short-subunit dehydrogenase